jgi:hypothetical protein
MLIAQPTSGASSFMDVTNPLVDGLVSPPDLRAGTAPFLTGNGGRGSEPSGSTGCAGVAEVNANNNAVTKSSSQLRIRTDTPDAILGLTAAITKCASALEEHLFSGTSTVNLETK